MSLIRHLFGREEGDAGDEDARRIAKLESAGVDLSQPLLVEHFLSLPDERMARQVVAKLASTGGTVQLSPGLIGRRWTVRVAFPMIVTLERITALREQLGAFAEQHGGEYTSWDASGDTA
jgi:Regulator of ribonuclease activity B